MDNVIESTSSLLQTVLDSATQKLIDAWANHNSEDSNFCKVITNTVRAIGSPFTGLDTNY